MKHLESYVRWIVPMLPAWGTRLVGALGGDESEWQEVDGADWETLRRSMRARGQDIVWEIARAPFEPIGDMRGMRVGEFRAYVERFGRPDGVVDHDDGTVQLVAIEGTDLSAVTFVRDYVQLGFNGPARAADPGFSAFTWPEVHAASHRSVFGDPGYRDALCGQIGKRVTTAIARNATVLEIVFQDDSFLSISLRREDRRYGSREAVYFNDPASQQSVVW